jgi:hypothetical protein
LSTVAVAAAPIAATVGVARGEPMSRLDESCGGIIDRFIEGAAAATARGQARWLRDNCRHAAMSRGALAVEIGVDERTVERWMKPTQRISPEHLERLQFLFAESGLNLDDYTPSLRDRGIAGYLAALGFERGAVPPGDWALEMIQALDTIHPRDFSWPSPRSGRRLSDRLGRDPKHFASPDAIRSLVEERGQQWSQVLDCLYRQGFSVDRLTMWKRGYAYQALDDAVLKPLMALVDEHRDIDLGDSALLEPGESGT